MRSSSVVKTKGVDAMRDSGMSTKFGFGKTGMPAKPDLSLNDMVNSFMKKPAFGMGFYSPPKNEKLLVESEKHLCFKQSYPSFGAREG